MKNFPKIKILFLDIFTDDKTARRRFEQEVFLGTYADCMRKAFNVSKSEMEVVEGTAVVSKDPLDYDGIVIGGSLENPIQGIEKPWMKDVYIFIRSVVQKEVPLLGICGGLQFTVRALGGSVIFNPKGRELGNISVTLNREGSTDSLFEGLPPTFRVPASHRCMAQKLPDGWKIFASSSLCTIQAIGAGSRVRLVQFHPEQEIEHLQASAQLDREVLLREGFIQDEKSFEDFTASLSGQEHVGKKICRNFLEYFVETSCA